MDKRKTAAKRPLLAMQSKLAKAAQRQQLPSLSRPREGGISRASHEQAIAELLADAQATGEGTRIIGLAATRKGKTAFARKLLAAMLGTGVADVALIHDAKYADRAQYPGQSCITREQMQGAVTAGFDVVARSPDPATANDLAELSHELLAVGIKPVVVIDEGAFSLGRNKQGEPMEREWYGPALTRLHLQDGAAGASSIVLWQMLRQAPGSNIDSASAFYVGNLGGRSLAYAKDYRIIPVEALPVVTALAPGEICLFFADREWDRTIYYSEEKK